MTERSSCRHCYGVIIPCPTPSGFCKGWVHADFLASMPIGAHYCGGRSANPMAEPGERTAVVIIEDDPAPAPVVFDERALAVIGMYEDGSEDEGP